MFDYSFLLDENHYFKLTGTTLPSHQPLTVFAEMWVEESDEEEKDSPIHSSETGALPQSNSHPKPLAVSWLTHVDICMHTHASTCAHTYMYVHTHIHTRTCMHLCTDSVNYVQCCKWRTRTAGGGHLLFNRRQDQLYSSLLRLATGTTEDSNTNSTTVAHRLVFCYKNFNTHNTMLFCM